MRVLFPVALAALVVSCHLDKLLTGGGGGTPPSQAPPARVVFSSQLNSARAGAPISPPVQVAVHDSAGRITLRDTLVILSLGANPSGDSLRGTKQVRSVNGVATFANLRLDKAASGYTLTAAAPELQPDTSAAFSVMPAPATQLLFTVPPSSAMQDSAIKPPVQVTAYDSLGNKATNFTGTIQLGIGTDGSVSKKAKLSGAVAPATAGVATFPNLRIDSVGGGYTLTAAFGTAEPVDTSTAFDITLGPPPPPPPPTHLGFTQQPPQTTEAGAAITPPVQVAALDAAEHVVQGFTGAIGLALEPASNGGTLSGGAPINAVNGIATFPNLSIDKAGTGYTLRATASPLTDATSRTFDITAPPSGSLRVTTSTSGDNPDADGYTVTVDGTTSQPITSNNPTGVTFNGLPTGDHQVELSGVAANCTVTAPNPRSVSVPAGGTASTTFTITCTALTGDLTVTAATTGQDLDPDGYTVTVDGGQSRSLGVNASTTYTLTAASHTVELSGIAANCTVSGQNPRTVSVPTGGTTTTFTITCTALTGSVTVSTNTSGSDQPSGYTVSVTGGGSQTIGATGSVTFNGLATGSHTVTLSGAPSNCSVNGGTSQTVNVAAGQTATASFTISCVALTGSLTVSTNTSGSDQPSGYTVSVTGGGSQTIGATGSVTFNGLATGSHTVTLSGVPGNCSVTGGTSQTVNVAAGQTATASFSISCVALTGSLSVSTNTSGGTPDPDGYTVSVSGGGSQPIGNNGSVTFSGLTAGSHTVTLGGIAANCTVNGGPSQTVNVPAGGSTSASFSVDCPTPPPPNQPPSVTAGGEQFVLVGALFSLQGASFSDPDHNGPWTVTIDWGDGTSDTFTATSEGSISRPHSYPVTLLPHDYQLTVTVEDADGARNSATKTVHVTVA